MATVPKGAVDASANPDTACPSRPPLFVARPPLSRSGRPVIQRVLIANRGEIACRIIATCRKLSITSIAVYVTEDAMSLHVSQADESINIGSITAEGTNPFLDIKLLIDAAKSTKADAIHPGYGYLSENAEFSDAVAAAGLKFIGPSAEAMSTLGDKRTSKEYLRENDSKVPLIPGYAGSSQNVEDLEGAAEDIGYPVMLKASAGGGGRGMRIVHDRSKLRDELKSAQSEASRSFGSGDCILEKYIESGKHIEIQIIGDSKGNVVSLWERECSVQRRNQKIIEETPSPWLSQDKRREMSEVAVRIGKLLEYEGAGTVEFVVDAKTGSFYFLEVNTRLQVEHPITEEVTGLDIVSLQLFVAAGGSLATLPVLQNIPQEGHAIECRLCAEDPQRDFFPEHGTIRLWKEASLARGDSRDIRYETAVRTGSQITIYFDSMIAKIVVWAPSRSLAIEKMAIVMAETVCAGLRTNQLFLQSCLLHPSFRDPGYTTSFIPTHFQELCKAPYPDAAAALWQALPLIPSVFMRNVGKYLPSASASRPFRNIRRGFRNQPYDPVNFHSDVVTTIDPSKATNESSARPPVLCMWRMAGRSENQEFEAYTIEVPVDVDISKEQKEGTKNLAATEVTAKYNAISSMMRSGRVTQSPKHRVKVDSCQATIAKMPPDTQWITAAMDVTINGVKIRVSVATETDSNDMSGATQIGQAQRVFCHVHGLGTWLEFRPYNLLSYCESLREEATGGDEAKLKTVTAPMPCKILSILKKSGDSVKSGETVMVIESMKMETNIAMSTDGEFETNLKQGEAVDEGTVLCWVK